jgi:3D (Asp-Asp-Asp) domain-containing protein
VKRLVPFLALILFSVAFLGILQLKTPQLPEGVRYDFIGVAKGDTLWKIAERYYPDHPTRDMVWLIKQANGLDGGTIYPGQTLKLPLMEDSQVAARPTRAMTATAYSLSAEEGTADGITRTGTRVRRGVAAVDPDVVPLGSRLYVEGYGLAVAEDTGGKIKGDRVDLFFPDREEALQFGVKRVNVTILD